MRLVVKVGSSTLSHGTGGVNLRFLEKFCMVLADLKNAGNQIILVSSGAIAMGVSKLGLGARPDDMPSKQAAAAVGQCELMYMYDKFFGGYGQTVAQILLTGDDLSDGRRRMHFEDASERLLSLGVIPVINENDTVATSEIAVGDNDTLAAIVAVGVKADLLVLLTDTEGLYTGDPRKDGSAKLIPYVDRITEEMMASAGGAGSGVGTGGMHTKLQAAKLCMDGGTDMIIASGANPEVLYAAVAGESVGTRFGGKKR